MSANRQGTQDNSRGHQRGVGVVELIIVIAIVGILAAIAVINFRRASVSMRLQNSVRQLASFMERARLDAVRRHSTSSITFSNTNTYVVRMDFTNTGAVTDRTYTFQPDIQLASAELPAVTFDWRGRTSSAGTICVTTFSVKSTNPNEGLSVDVSGSGDVTVENQLPSLPNVSYTNVNSSSGVNIRAGVSGSTVPDNSPCVDVAGVMAGDSGPPSCGIHSDKTVLYIKKNGGSTGSVLISMSVPSLITVTKPSNLTVSPTSASVTNAGSTFLITSTNTLRGPFNVTFASQCGSSLTVRVNVTN
jgi:prepilin-type N-terminal cleavage/methylation domain-containing protein